MKSFFQSPHIAGSIGYVRRAIDTHRTRFVLLVGALLLAVLFSWIFLIRPPQAFPEQSFFNVQEGLSVSSIAEALHEANIIRSPGLFKALVVFMGTDRGVLAGQYFLSEPEHMLRIAQRLLVGDHRMQPVRITIPEGFNVEEIALLLDEKIPSFDTDYFIEHAREGYMFPDTYFIFPNATSADVISMMRDNFDKKVAPLSLDIAASGRPLADIVTMASIIEEEARVSETRNIISGILWKRISINMPLQVDVTFQYINGKNTYNLTLDDLSIDSPYNTYKYVGLPPTPISNPGFDSIRAAVQPEETQYLYFLSSRNGTMYYAKDFEEHKQNRILYLD